MLFESQPRGDPPKAGALQGSDAADRGVLLGLAATLHALREGLGNSKRFISGAKLGGFRGKVSTT